MKVLGMSGWAACLAMLLVPAVAGAERRGPGRRHPDGPGRVVKGVPYQADAVSEFTQTLADGNRITQSTTSRSYRDGEGRTRREEGGASPRVFIHDPVAGVSYALDPDTRTARQIGPHSGKEWGPGPGHGPEGRGPRDVKTENLGKRVLAGIEVEGMRRTITIAAGTIGNEKPIQIVSERWVSPELQVVVMSRRVDPQSGEVTRRLTAISRSEPDPALFQVPEGYTRIEGRPGSRSAP